MTDTDYTELPRARALLRLDGPGHIMPVEPVTPPDSTAWRVIHFPVMLGVVAIGLFLATIYALKLLSLGIQVFSYVPGGRYLTPLIAATAIGTLYWVFVRIVERRPTIDELGGRGWFGELGAGFCGGLALSAATFGILGLLGAVGVLGFNAPNVMLLPLIVELCTAFILEILLRGLFFRLAERLVGSWLALLLTALILAVALLSGGGEAALPGVSAFVLRAGLTGAALYMLTRRLWAAIGLLAAWRFAQIGLNGVAMSASGPHGLVLSYVAGPDWLTGGNAGTDGSVPGLVLNVVLIVTLLAMAIRRGRIVRPVWRRGRVA